MAGNGEKEMRTEFWYGSLKERGVGCRKMINRVLKFVCKGADWIQLAEDSGQWRVIVITAANLGLRKMH